MPTKQQTEQEPSITPCAQHIQKCMYILYSHYIAYELNNFQDAKIR